MIFESEGYKYPQMIINGFINIYTQSNIEQDIIFTSNN